MGGVRLTRPGEPLGVAMVDRRPGRTGPDEGRPAGRFGGHRHVVGAGSSPVTSRSTTRVAPDSRSRSAVEPPIVTSDPIGRQRVVRSGRRRRSADPALNVRVAVTGRSVIVTWTVSIAERHDAGRQRERDVDRRVEPRPRRSGSAAVSSSLERRRAGRHRPRPSRRRVDGRSMSISKPAAGVPVTIGLTGSVRVWRSVKTGIWTRAVGGRRPRPGSRRCRAGRPGPAGRPGRHRCRRAGWRTSAWAATTSATTDAAPTP